MSRSSGSGQAEPLAAILAVLALGAGLSAYAVVLDATVPAPDRDLAGPTIDRVERAVTEAGVVDPTAVADGPGAGPDGYRTNVTLDVGGRTWHAGPPAPSRADGAEVAVSVRTGPGRVRTGVLRVEVWR